MLYPITDNKIPHDKRAGINDKIILSLARGKKDITNTEIYNSYTGIGGLHGLDINDFSSYHEYSEAKKSFELGQFFTPHGLCEQMVNLVSPQANETVLDMCCGMGNFFNHLPNLFNAYGFDIDENAVKVARRLYPDANIEINDMRVYDPGMTFDIIFGNPPFNLDIEGIKSQHFFSHKAYWLLNPGGLIVLVMPMSYLASESADRTYISMIDRDFSFIGQTQLDPNTFSSLGVQNFETKALAFMRKTDTMNAASYCPDHFVSWDELRQKIDDIKAEKKKLRLKLLREKNMMSEGALESRLKNYKASREKDIEGKKKSVEQKDIQLNTLFKSMSVHEGARSFEATLEKYLFELKTHKHLQSQYPKAVAYVAKFRSQKPPMNATQEQITHWEKYIRISPTQVLDKLRRIIKRQNIKPEKKYRLVRTQYGYKLKNYNHPFAERNTDKYVSLIDLVAHDIPLPEPKKMTSKLQKEYAQARKVIAGKKREMLLECADWKDMKHDAGLDKYIDSLTFVGMKNTECKFSGLQKEDMGLAYQKRYSLLNWQQGSGKTAVLYHFGKYQLARYRVKNIVIVAPSIAVHMTWEVFLQYNKEDYILVSRPEQLDNIPQGKFIIISVSMLGKIDSALRLFMKKKSQKVCLLFDESDELTNDQALRTKRTLKCFRKAKYKMLGTGTTTRNYISELYSQFQLMYNSSLNFICYVSLISIIKNLFQYEEGLICSRLVSIREKLQYLVLKSIIRMCSIRMHSGKLLDGPY
jgi:SAM-dependent methyltransferase